MAYSVVGSYYYMEAKHRIKFYCRTRGPYFNNIVSSILKEVSDTLGRDEANRLIRECQLEKLGWREEKED